MAKLTTDPIGVSDIDEYLATSSDFALELFVCSTARECGLTALHSGTYADSVTGKHRQFDVRASKSHRNYSIALAIECKALQLNCPLVVLRTPRRPVEAMHQIIHSFETTQPVPGYVSARSIPIRGGSQLYTSGEMVGRSTAQVGRIANDRSFVSGDSSVYEKWAQALSSAADLVQDAVRAHRLAEKSATVSAVLPILVVSDETLWVADYTDDGTRIGQPIQVDEALVCVGRVYEGPGNFNFTATHMHIYTKRGIAQFLNLVGDGGRLWNRLFPHEKVPSNARLGG